MAGRPNCRHGVLFPSFVVLFALVSASLSSTQVNSQSTSCDVAPSSDWNSQQPEDFLEVSSIDDGSFGGFFEGILYDEARSSGDGLFALENSLSTEWSDGTWVNFPRISVDNDSATTLGMVLVPGYLYTFCIQFSHSEDSLASGARGDVYLMTSQNYDIYTFEYESREWNDQDLDMIPVEWRDMSTWITFRDSHAYESVSYQEFSVAIDSSGTAWSSLGLQASQNQIFYLVLDGWDSSSENDAGALGGVMNVEILIDVEERQTLPNYTAYLLIAVLPLSCIIIPFVLHSRYLSSAMDNDEVGMRQVPILREND